MWESPLDFGSGGGCTNGDCESTEVVDSGAAENTCPSVDPEPFAMLAGGHRRSHRIQLLFCC